MQLWQAGPATRRPGRRADVTGRVHRVVGHGFTGEPRQVWLAADDDRPGRLLPARAPAPGERRPRGPWCSSWRRARDAAASGSELLAHCCAQAGQDGPDAGWLAETLEGAPGDAFARAAGGRAGLTEVRRDAAGGRRPARAAGPAARRGRAGTRPAYALLTWAGPAPAEYLDQVARRERGHERRAARGRHRARALGRRPGPVAEDAAASRRAAVLGGGPPRRHAASSPR